MSAYFNVDEFRCHDGTPYPDEWIADRLTALCAVLDTIRHKWDGPLTVVSGYRTAGYNKRVGGAALSQHVQGRAADIRPTKPSPQRVAELHRQVKQQYATGDLPALGGIGLYPGWIHVDVRFGDRLAQWSGAGVGSEISA